MKIYTRMGDNGETGLLHGRRISKGSDNIEAIGEVDELSAFIGLARSHPFVSDDTLLDGHLKQMQNRLFDLGAELADKEDAPQRVTLDHATEVEQWIDQLTQETPPIRHFILPAGHEGASRLHVARSVARRAERALVRLSEGRTVSNEAITYLNRLSDYLFTAARYVNVKAGYEEDIWKGD